MASGRKPSICNALSQMASLIPSNYDGTADENGITIPPHLNYYRPSPAQVAAQAASDEADGAIYEEPHARCSVVAMRILPYPETARN